MALRVLFLLVALTQGSLSASNNTSTPKLETSTTITTITTALTASDTTPSRANVTSKAASSPVPPSTTATTSSSTTKTNDPTSSWTTVTSPTGSKEPLTTQTAESVNGSTQAGHLSPEPAFSTKPGLVVVICLFVFVLVIGVVVVLIKCCRPKEPAFKKLDEVPMAKVAEDSPFARYPPK